MTNSAIQLSTQYVQAGDLVRAELTLRSLLRDEAEDLPGWCLLGRNRQASGQPQEALPHSPGALIGLSVLHLETGDLEQALIEARQAVQLNPQLAATRSQLGAVLLKMGRHQEAVEHLRAALQVAPDRGQALEHLGLA